MTFLGETNEELRRNWFFSAAFLEGEASELPRDRPGLLELSGPDQPDQNSTEPELLILFW